MADVSQERGYGGEQKPALAHQDEFGHKTDNDSPAIDGSGYGGVSESEPPHHKIHNADEPLPKPSAGYAGDEQGLQEQGEEAYVPAEDSTPQNSQFGLEGKTASNGSTGATVPDREEESHEAPAGHGAPPAGSTIDEDASPKAKKEGFMSKLMDKLPGHHPKSPDATAFDAPTETGSPTTPKKGLVTKLKEKLPGHHDKSNDI